MTATDTNAPLPESAQRVADHLRTLGYEKAIVMLPATGKTSAEAAAGLGCSVAEIAKSIIFRRAEDDVPVLVIASGTNRVDEAKVSAHVGALAKADATLHSFSEVLAPDGSVSQLIVEWSERGQVHRYRSSINASLTVVSSGICLSGRDRDFDLTSLVSVMADSDDW